MFVYEQNVRNVFRKFNTLNQCIPSSYCFVKIISVCWYAIEEQDDRFTGNTFLLRLGFWITLLSFEYSDHDVYSTHQSFIVKTNYITQTRTINKRKILKIISEKCFVYRGIVQVLLKSHKPIAIARGIEGWNQLQYCKWNSYFKRCNHMGEIWILSLRFNVFYCFFCYK